MSMNAPNFSTAIPPELPSRMSEFDYPIISLEIDVTCCNEEFAKEQAKRISNEIDWCLKCAIEKGWSVSNSKYQNINLKGKQLSFEFYGGITFLIYSQGGPCFEPLTYYNQYEAPRVESVTFQFILESNEDSAIEVYKNFFQKCLESQKIDELVINAQSFRITSNGPNPFRKLVNACCSAHLEWQNVVKTEVE